MVSSTFEKQPVRDECYVAVQIVRGDRQVAPAAPQLRAPVSRKDEIQP